MEIRGIDVDISNVPEKKKFRSLIKKYFSDELCVELEVLSKLSLLNNNEKAVGVYDLLDQYIGSDKYIKCGRGTNRMAVALDGYCIKIALDDAGALDNKREFAYAPKLAPHVTNVYECLDNGLLATFEYVTVFEQEDMMEPVTKTKLVKILTEVADKYFIGDIGLTSKNYTNWGIRRSTGAPVMLDFAYVYDTSYRLFSCDNVKCTGSILKYNNTFTDLVCPKCGAVYPFKVIREKINTKSQLLEIGDLKKQGYVITQATEEVPTIYDPDIDDDVAKAYDEAVKNIGYSVSWNEIKRIKKGEREEYETEME